MSSNRKSSDELELTIDGPVPILIPDGTYDATVPSTQKVVRFGRPMVDFSFRVATDPYAGVVLPGFTVLGRNGTIPPSSKIARWWMLIAQFEHFARRDRIALRTFKDFLFQVKVDTVTRDHEHKPLLQAHHHSVVREIIAVVGRIKKA